jgi:hypothetical protein
MSVEEENELRKFENEELRKILEPQGQTRENLTKINATTSIFHLVLQQR